MQAKQSPSRYEFRSEARPETERRDLLRRFTATPYAANLSVMGSTIRLESNSPSIVEKAMSFFARHQGSPHASPQFLWRVVGESRSQTNDSSAAVTAFSDGSLRFANLAHDGFLAVDLRDREAVAFVHESVIESEPVVHCRPLFDTLFCMCAASLGKTSFEAACIAKGDRGILLLGPANSGKTTTAYIAAKQGLEFHADQAVFLEMLGGRPRVWGDLLPAVFRPESLQFYPELRTSTLRFSHPSFNVHYLCKKPFQSRQARSVNPICCVFLKRGNMPQPSLTPIAPRGRAQRFLNAVLYREVDEFHPQTSAVIGALVKLPNYQLAFRDPPDAVRYITDLLGDAEPRSQLQMP